MFDFCKSKTRTIKNFDHRIFENRLTTLDTIWSQHSGHFVLVLLAFVVLGLVWSLVLSQEIGWEKRLRRRYLPCR